ncbi:hypothetical protein Ahy_B03g062319 [Arachis hypogaea]|uniref:Uncharacterized protein n=1 Tax=Arachis hypogaea TaxID=3818 RepID=A0A444ZTX5_ARAHY|nr:hypothetical protein Ahy_B03g062319 [Arachis hypogaea]
MLCSPPLVRLAYCIPSSRLVSPRLAVPCLKLPLLDSAFCCLDWFCNNRNKERGEIGDKRHTGSTCKSLGCNPQGIAANRLRCLVPQYRRSVVKAKTSDTTECAAMVNTNFRRDFLGLILGISSLFVGSLEAKGAALPPKDKPKLCDEACEKELENVPMVTTESGLQYKDIKVGQGPSPPVGFQVAANYVAMIPSEQVFDR